ncbi:uncharacterized protein STEHIDRAFT_114152 [Stereum hirsutum FP-91666 SS1]|uniref:uncharacterized protein n=1 Tax=Stereum hirsutum (strain FP-91666) TaxID=721885 RepID=UPI000444A39C|nr:uncharacterized protein STEHIDRAFT_114152 [Stereum hirsutum FP-91666 SS1]EIM83151.1 hypothetical protein STEHIDRAFT_114152 [Stereum hirsutum FP-91666 SS1]
MYGPGGKHAIFPVVSPNWRVNNAYLDRFLVQEGYLSITLGTDHLPKAYKTNPPFYSITITATQRQPRPAPRLGILGKCEIWGEDGLDQLRRVVVRGHFMFPCWACDGVCDSAYDHRNCPYGIMKVDPALLHPRFDKAGVPETPFFAYQMNEIWQSIPNERHLRLTLAYPPGYQRDITTWYQYYPPTAVFTTEMEAEYVRAEQRRRGWVTEDDGERRHRLIEESREERKLAHRAVRLARLVAETCQAKYMERTYHRFLRSIGIGCEDGERGGRG